MTNYEKIKDMTVDEMAEFIKGIIGCDYEVCRSDCRECLSYENNAKQWLESEEE